MRSSTVDSRVVVGNVGDMRGQGSEERRSVLTRKTYRKERLNSEIHCSKGVIAAFVGVGTQRTSEIDTIAPTLNTNRRRYGPILVSHVAKDRSRTEKYVLLAKVLLR